MLDPAFRLVSLLTIQNGFNGDIYTRDLGVSTSLFIPYFHVIHSSDYTDFALVQLDPAEGSGLKAPISADQSGFTVNMNTSTDQLTYTSQTLTIQQVVSYTDSKTGTTHSITHSANVVLTNSCQTTTYNSISPTTNIVINYTTGMNELRLQLPQVKDQASIDTSPNDGLTFCGMRNFAFAPGSTQTYLTIDNAAQEFVVSAPNPTSPAASYTDTVEVRVQIGANFYKFHEFQITVAVSQGLQCSSMLLQSLSSADANKSYIYELNTFSTLTDTLVQPTDTLSVLYPSFDIPTLCPHSYAWALSPSNDGFMTFYDSSRQFSFAVGSNLGDPHPTFGLHSYSIQVELRDGGNILLDSVQFQVTIDVQLDCSEMQFEPVLPAELLTQSFQIELDNQYTLSEFLDIPIENKFMVIFPQLNIPTLCPFSYQYTLSPPNDGFLTFNQQIMQINYAVDPNPGSARPTAGISSYTLSVNIIEDSSGTALDQLDVTILIEVILETSSEINLVMSQGQPFPKQVVVELIVGQSWFFQLPEIEHSRNFPSELKLMKGTASFISYNQISGESGNIEIPEGRTKEKDVGFHTILYYAFDQQNSQSAIHSISLQIISTLQKDKEEDSIVKTYTINEPTIQMIDEETKQIVENDFLNSAMSNPKAKIEQITSSGQVFISFNKEMRDLNIEFFAKKVAQNARLLKEDKIQNQNQNQTEQKKEKQQTWKEIQNEIFKVQINQKGGVDEQNPVIDYDWTILDSTSRNLDMILEFTVPSSVSSTSDGFDELNLKFKDSSFFTDIYGYSIEADLSLTAKIPPQISAEEKAIIDTTGAAIQNGSSLALASNFVLNLALAGSLNQLWSLIRSQQLIILLPLFNVILPANAGMVFNMLMQIAAFDPYETGDMLNYLLDTPETGPFSESFGVIGLDSTLFLNNLGSQIFIIFLMAFMYTLYALMYIFRNVSKSLKQKMKDAKRIMFWSLPIRYFSESFTVIMLCATINLDRISFESFGLILNAILSLTFLSVCVLLLPFVWNFFNKRARCLKDRKVRQKFGSLYSDMQTRPERVRAVQIFQILYFVRRILLILSIIFLKNVLSLQIFVFTMMLIFQVILLGFGKPFTSQAQNRWELLNELFILAIMYHIICFTGLVQSNQVRFFIGYMSIGFIVIHLGLNMYKLVRQNFHSLKLVLKLIIFKRQRVSQMNRNRKRMDYKALALRLATSQKIKSKLEKKERKAEREKKRKLKEEKRKDKEEKRAKKSFIREEKLSDLIIRTDKIMPLEKVEIDTEEKTYGFCDIPLPMKYFRHPKRQQLVEAVNKRDLDTITKIEEESFSRLEIENIMSENNSFNLKQERCIHPIQYKINNVFDGDSPKLSKQDLQSQSSDPFDTVIDKILEENNNKTRRISRQIEQNTILQTHTPRFLPKYSNRSRHDQENTYFYNCEKNWDDYEGSLLRSTHNIQSEHESSPQLLKNPLIKLDYEIQELNENQEKSYSSDQGSFLEIDVAKIEATKGHYLDILNNRNHI